MSPKQKNKDMRSKKAWNLIENYIPWYLWVSYTENSTLVLQTL